MVSQIYLIVLIHDQFSIDKSNDNYHIRLNQQKKQFQKKM